MKTVLAPEIERCRDGGPAHAGPYGSFRLVHPDTGRSLVVIASDGRDWFESQPAPTADDLLRVPPKVRELLARKWKGLPTMTLPAPAWEHVSVSAKTGVPRWEEMVWIKGLFWEPHEWVVQFHPAEEDYVNDHSNVLHLWRPIGLEFPHPPKEVV